MSPSPLYVSHPHARPIPVKRRWIALVTLVAMLAALLPGAPSSAAGTANLTYLESGSTVGTSVVRSSPFVSFEPAAGLGSVFMLTLNFPVGTTLHPDLSTADLLIGVDGVTSPPTGMVMAGREISLHMAPQPISESVTVELSAEARDDAIVHPTTATQSGTFRFRTWGTVTDHSVTDVRFVGAASRIALDAPEEDLPAGALRRLDLEVQDTVGNRVTNSDITSIAVAKTGEGDGTVSGLEVPAVVEAGVASLDVTGATAGRIILTTTAGGLDEGSTEFDVVPGKVAAGHSTMSASQQSITADGVSTSTITVHAKDPYSNSVTDGAATVTLSTTAGTLDAGTTNAIAHDNGDGTYTATLTSSSSATTATISGGLHTDVTPKGPLANTVDVAFVAVPPSEVAPPPLPSTPVAPPPTTDRGTPAFRDVTGNTHEAAIDKIHRYGVTAGVNDTTYNPAGDLSRGQMSSFLVRLLVLTDPTITRPVSHEAAMHLLVERGILLGQTDGDLDGSGALTRGQAASLLVRLIEQTTGETLATGTTTFADAGGTHGESIAKLAELGVVSGYTDNTYRPHLELRRDQAASLIARTIDRLIEAGKISSLP